MLRRVTLGPTVTKPDPLLGRCRRTHGPTFITRCPSARRYHTLPTPGAGARPEVPSHAPPGASQRGRPRQPSARHSAARPARPGPARRRRGPARLTRRRRWRAGSGVRAERAASVAPPPRPDTALRRGGQRQRRRPRRAAHSAERPRTAPAARPPLGSPPPLAGRR